jgi:2-polyprenyl-3-methyl-5-hydroxy-6-metoxy-1,4-benzoquinol methylase
VWSASEPSSRSDRRCDAEQTPTPHQRVETRDGAYWICAACGQLHRAGTAENLPGLYDDWWRNEIDRYQPSERDVASCRAWIDRIEPYRRTGRLFEVGAGLGLFLKTAGDADWQPEGNDISPVATAFAEKQCGGRVHAGEMETIDLERGVYDVVLCKDVFEHLREPGAVLRKLADALRPGGVIFFQTLSAQSLSLWFAPTGWLYYGEGHLFIPTLKSLDLYFRAAGLRAVRRETHGFRAPGIDAAGVRLPKRRSEKLLATVAGRSGRGHRVKMLLRKEAPDGTAKPR